ncbi:hypothetical protein evm_009330 [Chilo suppressalis]|nr:hypothetical protein evm_009330 [Chilo suppressalis]
MEKVDQFTAWKNALKIDCKINPHMKVCSLHFLKDDYILPDIPSQQRQLKKTAIPSCNLPQSTVGRKEKKTGETEREKRLKRRNAQTESSKGLKEKTKDQEDSQHPKTEEILENVDNKEENSYCVEAETKSFADIGVQVESDYLRPSFTMFIKDNEALSTATGIETLEILDTIVDIVKTLTDNGVTYSNARMSLRERIIMTYVKLKQNISYSLLALNKFNYFKVFHHGLTRQMHPRRRHIE